MPNSKTFNRFATVFTFVASASILYHGFILRKDRPDCSGDYYCWEYGDVFYRKSGSGKPLVLIHSLSPESSSFEWSKLIPYLEKSFTVYAVDLPGCGISDKDISTYTEFLYAKFLNSFINDVVGERSLVITSAGSANIAASACHLEPELYEKLVFLNPASIIHKQNCSSSIIRYYLSFLFRIPVLDTILYNLRYNAFVNRYVYSIGVFHDVRNISDEIVNASVYNALFNGSRGKFLLASILSGSLCFTSSKDVYKLDVPSVLIRLSSKKKNRDFLNLNRNAREAVLLDVGSLPQLEYPEALSEYLYSNIL